MKLTAAELKARIDPRAFYQAELPLVRYPSGNEWAPWGLCPFHPHNQPGPFRVNLESGVFYCHACGAKGGSVIDFVIKRDGLDFKQALDLLRRCWG